MKAAGREKQCLNTQLFIIPKHYLCNPLNVRLITKRETFKGGNLFSPKVTIVEK